jgi:hypothetical protein
MNKSLYQDLVDAISTSIEDYTDASIVEDASVKIKQLAKLVTQLYAEDNENDDDDYDADEYLDLQEDMDTFYNEDE